MSSYLIEANRLFDLITNRYCDTDKMLFTRIDSDTGEVVDTNILVSDFGDYIQNFYLLGKILNQPEICHWSSEHLVKASHHYQSQQGYFFTKNSSKTLFIYENADTFEGLSTFFSLSNDNRVKEIILRFVKGIKLSMDSKGLIGHIIKPLFASPVSRSDYTGNFIEELVLLSQELKDREYFELAQKLLKPWIESNHYKKTGLIPNWQLRSSFLSIPINFILDKVVGRNPLRRSSIVKFNSNVMSGVLQLYLSPFSSPTEKQEYKKILYNWTENIEKKLGRNGFYYGTFDDTTQKASNYSRPLPDNHHILAMYADLYYYFKDQSFLEMLTKSVDKWLEFQHSETGLFPENPLDQTGENGQRSIMDSNLDLSIVILKLYQLTGHKKYLDASQRCIDGMIRLMKRDYGYIEMVKTESGEVFIHSRNFVKYLSLFIKGLILLDQAIKGTNLYERKLFLIARDR